jgi:hypothetical protein
MLPASTASRSAARPCFASWPNQQHPAQSVEVDLAFDGLDLDVIEALSSGPHRGQKHDKKAEGTVCRCPLRSRVRVF